MYFSARGPESFFFLIEGLVEQSNEHLSTYGVARQWCRLLHSHSIVTEKGRLLNVQGGRTLVSHVRFQLIPLSLTKGGLKRVYRVTREFHRLVTA